MSRRVCRVPRSGPNSHENMNTRQSVYLDEKKNIGLCTAHARQLGTVGVRCRCLPTVGNVGRHENVLKETTVEKS